MKNQKIKLLEDFDFKDKNVFMRVDFNVPIQEGKIIDYRRIEKTIPSIQFILDRGGRLLLASHLGRPGGKKIPSLSLNPVAEYLSQAHNLEVFFVEEPDSLAPKVLFSGLKDRQLILLENLRFHPGEEGKDKHFSQRLASYTDIYINEGFSISHRHHTSLTLLPESLPQKGIGLQFEEEIRHLSQLKEGKAQRPFLVILGGSKIKDKIPLMSSLLDFADEFLAGGLIACTFLKAMGKDMGKTPIPSGFLSQTRNFLERIEGRNKKIFFPLDHLVQSPKRFEICSVEDRLPPGSIVKDIGPATMRLFKERIGKAKSIFWNGPMGFFEKELFHQGTFEVALALADQKSAFRIVGGGHSATAVMDFEKDLDHVSTGGGSALSYLQGKELAGLKSLQKNS